MILLLGVGFAGEAAALRPARPTVAAQDSMGLRQLSMQRQVMATSAHCTQAEAKDATPWWTDLGTPMVVIGAFLVLCGILSTSLSRRLVPVGWIRMLLLAFPMFLGVALAGHGIERTMRTRATISEWARACKTARTQASPLQMEQQITEIRRDMIQRDLILPELVRL